MRASSSGSSLLDGPDLRASLAANVVNELASNRKFGITQAGLARLSNLVAGLAEQYETILGKESKRAAALQAQMRVKNSNAVAVSHPSMHTSVDA
jgi:hypothetical protein